MVIEHFKQVFKCPYCEDKFDSYDRCNDHIDDCLDREYPKEDEEWEYECSMCQAVFENEWDAESCEEKHIDTEDYYFKLNQEKEERNKLLIAGNHPSQLKLIQ